MKQFSRSAKPTSASALRRLRERAAEAASRQKERGSLEQRTFSALTAAITSGNAASLNRIEWIRLCSGRSDWDLSSDDTTHLSASIWNYAAEDPDVARLLLRRVAMRHTGRKRAIQRALWRQFGVGTTALSVGNAGTLLRALIEGQYISIAEIAYEGDCTHNHLFAQHGLPTRPELLEPVYRHTSTVFLDLDEPSEADIRWYVRCLDESSVALQVKAAERMLRQLRETDVGGMYRPLRNWLQSTFNPTSGEGLWDRLSTDGKRLLRGWLGAATYKDFETVATLVWKHVSLETWEENQLRKRTAFWKNFSDNYLRVHILLPGQTRSTVGDQLRNELGTGKDIGQLERDGSAPTEVCVFDFRDWYVVEFFRGSGSEMRLFEASEALEKLFFSKTLPLSPRRIRALPSAEVFDHKYLWQPLCERWLHDHGIFVNEGLRRFYMGTRRDSDASWYQKYSRQEGLPYDRAKIQDRERGLRQWRQRIDILESKAKAYVRQIDLSAFESSLYETQP